MATDTVTVKMEPALVTVISTGTIGPPGPAGGGGAGGAPTDAGYLVATADATLTAEVVVGATPGGELGGTWAAPTVDATHAGSAHLALGTSGSTAAAGNDARLSDARTPTGAAGGVLSGTYPAPGFAADMATQAELDAHSADTTAVHGITDMATIVLTNDARLSDARTPTAHELTSAAHTESGLTAGHVLRASSGTAFDFAALADGDIPATIARDSEVTSAVSDHEGAANPHAGYATDADLSTHAGDADPHTGYQKESEKSAASGYASLDAGTKVPTAELGGAGADTTKFLRGDQSWVVPSGGGGAPTDADYLVGTAHAGLSAEVVVGTSPGGELGGTWASPTVDGTHSGSAHADHIAKAIVDAKGDLIVATAADTVARLAAGTNGQVLTADSVEATGVKWAAGGGGGGAPTTVDYLVGTADAGLSGEIVVGTSPGGELGGTWASPTVDDTHSGSAHADHITKALVDAKGDLLVATAADTVARLAVGTNGDELVADSAQSAGVKWAAQPPRLGDRWKTGHYYSVGITGGQSSTLGGTQSKLYLAPLICATTRTFDRICIAISSLAAASTTRLGIYNDDGTGYPGTLLLDAGTVDSTTTGFKEITISQQLTPGLYWVGACNQGGVPILRSIQNNMAAYVADTADPAGQNQGGYSQASVTGALPSTFSATIATEQNLPRVVLRPA